MIDTHCHLTDPRLQSQLAGVLTRAAANGVARMITVGTDFSDARAAIALCRRLPNLRCVVGVHPNYSQNVEIADLPQLRDIQNDPSVVALGEMGLDYFHQHAQRDKQHQVFEFQLGLATELGRPVVIHSREAIDDTLAHLRNFPAVRAVFHCFTGTRPEASRILDAGYLLGFDGPITYKKNDALREVVAMAPADRILVETDSPYLTPEPMRKQKVNEPGLVKYVAETVGKVKGWALEQVDAVTTANAECFFGGGRWDFPREG
ncbi:MAG TPA: TatD family hydrolase [Tepidisphaeraceae bacterium]|jgi:TatD DNase family protein|nr:TatD family hydrolase [Tepidisphaeraceae bacterium]